MDGGLEIEGLDLDLSLVGKRGRRAKDLELEIVGPIRPEDLMLQATAAPVAQTELKKLSSRHHSLARLLASGTTPGEASVIVGIKQAWVSTLQADPSFKELVRFYREGVDEKFAQTVDIVAGFSRDVLEELQERLETKPEEFTNSELKSLLVETLDRTGVGPTSTQKTVHTIELSGRLEQARERALAARRSEALMLDVTPE